jgi:hypothetical protein
MPQKPILTEELGSVLEIEDSCLEDPLARAAAAAARKGPPVIRGWASIDPQTGERVLTFEVDSLSVFEDSNTLGMGSPNGAQRKSSKKVKQAKKRRTA